MRPLVIICLRSGGGTLFAYMRLCSGSKRAEKSMDKYGLRQSGGRLMLVSLLSILMSYPGGAHRRKGLQNNPYGICLLVCVWVCSLAEAAPFARTLKMHKLGWCACLTAPRLPLFSKSLDPFRRWKFSESFAFLVHFTHVLTTTWSLFTRRTKIPLLRYYSYNINN
jgi:hypothetical protein